MGKPMSTHRMFSSEDILSKKSLSSVTPSSVSMSHSPVNSCSSLSPDTFSVVTLILSELRILNTVEVDSRILSLKILFPNILLINVDFPALVSPKRNAMIIAVFVLFADI